MSQPLMLVVAGPSGSGKSSLFPVREFGIPAFNADDVAAVFNGPRASEITPKDIEHLAKGEWNQIPEHLRTQRNYQGITPELRKSIVNPLCERFIQYNTEQGKSFAVETTLRSTIALEQMQKAKEAGFRTEMIYVGTKDVQINVDRVKARAADGQHSAPESQIRQVYNNSLVNVVQALEVADRVSFYDNSANHPASPGQEYFMRYEDGQIEMVPAITPSWGKAVLERAMEREQDKRLDAAVKQLDGKYALAGKTVDNYTVGSEVPNQASIASSLDDYTTLPGVRVIPMDQLVDPATDPKVVEFRHFMGARDQQQVRDLARAIESSKQLAPLIIVEEGGQYPYLLEGGHRLPAMYKLGAQAVPAIVAVDLGALDRSLIREESENTKTHPHKHTYEGKLLANPVVRDAGSSPVVNLELEIPSVHGAYREKLNGLRVSELGALGRFAKGDLVRLETLARSPQDEPTLAGAASGQVLVSIEKAPQHDLAGELVHQRGLASSHNPPQGLER